MMAAPKGGFRPRFIPTRYGDVWRSKWEYKSLWQWCPEKCRHKSKRDSLICAQNRYLSYRDNVLTKGDK